MKKPADDTIIGELWWERKEFAAVMGVDVRTLDSWEVKGIGPPRVKVGKRILYRKSSVLEWLASRETNRDRNGVSRGTTGRKMAAQR